MVQSGLVQFGNLTFARSYSQRSSQACLITEKSSAEVECLQPWYVELLRVWNFLTIYKLTPPLYWPFLGKHDLASSSHFLVL